MIQHRVFLDADDLAELESTGTLWFVLGDQRFELYTRPQPTTSEYVIRVHAEDLETLRDGQDATFDRWWGRLVLSPTSVPALEVAR